MRTGIVDAIREAGGEIYAVVAEPQSLASEAMEDWELPFASIGDPHLEIADECRRRGWLDLYVNERDFAPRSWATHINGFYQPGTLAVGADGQVLYRWRCKPGRDNLSGAGARPAPEYVWAEVQSNFASSGDAPLDEDPKLTHENPPWIPFVAALYAHGWFVRWKPFPLGRADDKPSAKVRDMRKRLVGFAGLWAAVFAKLGSRRGLALASAYALALTPSMKQLHKDFQNVRE